jgi:hypothetical protein
MKNIHILPTDKPSRLYKTGNFLLLDSKSMPNNTLETINQHIYITSDEEIKEGDWVYCKTENRILVSNVAYSKLEDRFKIILTTDQDLIKNGVQAIDDEFLEWFVENPSCEEVKIETIWVAGNSEEDLYSYKPVIPQEEPKPIYQQIIDIVGGEDRFREIAGIKPKQETLEEYIKEVTKNFGNEMSIKFTSGGIKLGAKWQQERMYSEKDIIDLIQFLSMNEDFNGYSSVSKDTAKRFLKQFKNK